MRRRVTFEERLAVQERARRLQRRQDRRKRQHDPIAACITLARELERQAEQQARFDSPEVVYASPIGRAYRRVVRLIWRGRAAWNAGHSSQADHDRARRASDRPHIRVGCAASGACLTCGEYARNEIRIPRMAPVLFCQTHASDAYRAAQAALTTKYPQTTWSIGPRPR